MKRDGSRQGTRPARAVYAGHKMDRRHDEELVIAARQGDVDAFAVLVERYRQPALRLAYGIAGDEAEDAVQDGFVKAFRSLDGFRTDAAFRPWLFTIVANEARNRRRSWSRRSKLALQVREQPQPTGAAADDVAAQHDQRRQLLDRRRAPSRAPPRGRLAALLRGLERERDGRGALVPDRHREIAALAGVEPVANGTG